MTIQDTGSSNAETAVSIDVFNPVVPPSMSLNFNNTMLNTTIITTMIAIPFTSFDNVSLTPIFNQSSIDFFIFVWLEMNMIYIPESGLYTFVPEKIKMITSFIVSKLEKNITITLQIF